MFTSDVYRQRRELLVARLAEQGEDSGLVLLPGNVQSPINYADNCFPFRQDSTWLYFFGIDEPGLAAIIDLDAGATRLFGADQTMDELVWSGPRPDARSFAAMAGVDHVAPADGFSKAIQAAARAKRPLRMLPPYRGETAIMLAQATGRSLAELAQGADSALIKAVVALREIKLPQEIVELEKAVDITVAMHKALLYDARPGWTEAQAAAHVSHIAAQRGARLSFRTIATTEGQVLHNHGYGGTMRPGGLFLLDAGAETASGYAGDLTTSFPISGRFSSRQADLYRLLLRVFDRATAELMPGKSFLDIHLAASVELASGLKELGIIKGDPVEAVTAGAHALFFPHGLGHMIGLDVHDMENLGEDFVGYDGQPRSAQFGLSSLRLAKTLKANMAHTVEPGIYFIPGLIDAWRAEGRHASFIDYEALESWKDAGGMRNEEDWLVTASGARRLGPLFDKSLEAIEAARDGV